MPRQLLLLASAVLLLIAAPVASAADIGAPATEQSGEFVPGSVIVQWASGADHGDKVGARADADVEYTEDLGGPRFQLVEAEPGDVAGAIRSLEADPAVAVAERDGYMGLNSIPNDPLFGQLWGLRNTGAGINGVSGSVAGDDIDAAAAWDRTVGSPSVVVADIDTGYRFTDPDLGPVAWTNSGEIPANGIDDDHNGFIDDVHGYDFVGSNASSPTSDPDPTDDNLISGGHGLHTAGTLGAAGNNNVGITGVAQNARIMPLRVCSNNSSNEDRCPNSSIISAINYAGSMGARAANMSLGGNEFSQTMVNALASHPQTLYVISAGNDSGNNDGGEAAPKGHHYPCDYRPAAESSPAVPGAIDNIVCVAATNQADGLASFSDWGAASVDIGAPGTETLSVYAGQEVPTRDDFETNNFGSKWTSSGSGFGRAGAGEGPLTSFGITDSPGATVAANSVHEVTQTTATAIPAGSGACEVKGRRYRHGGTLRYGYYDESGEHGFNNSADTAGSSMVSFNTVPILGLGGHNVKIFFRYTASASPTSADGLWLDDLRLECYAPITAPDSYEYLEGTSMAAPHVTGAAALLFSVKPTATVTEVRNALLGSVDPVASLAGKTTTGGRLDVTAALEVLVPPNTSITKQPAAHAGSLGADFEFTATEAPGGSFECKLDAGPFTPCASPDQLTVAAGQHDFQVRARAVGGAFDATPATATWTAEAPTVDRSGGGGESHRSGGGGTTGCKVPTLAGLSLAKAKAALAGAHCTLGTVGKPKAKHGKKLGPLVVKSSSPAAGANATGPVTLKLGPKPKKHHH